MEQKCTGRRRTRAAPSPPGPNSSDPSPRRPERTERAPRIRGSEELRTRGRGTYQLTGSALPSSYPAADCRPTRARSRNSGTVAAPA